MHISSENHNQDHCYTNRQIARDTEYADKYRDWVNSLSPEERTKMAALRVDKPLLQKQSTYGLLHEDLASSSLAREEATFIETIDEDSCETGDSVREVILDAFRRLIAEVLSQSNARLTLECLALACGLTMLQGESMTQIAKRHGISRAAVSKRCIELLKKLSLSPSRTMRSEKARKSYKKAQLELRNKYERIQNSGNFGK